VVGTVTNVVNLSVAVVQHHASTLALDYRRSAL
jgi:hypothetical protein